METNIKSGLESLLFVSGEPISFGKLSKVTGEKENVLKEQAEELMMDYRNRQGGMRIIIQDEKVQMVTSGEGADLVEKLLKIDIEGDLSRSALETISIIAYRGPISRAEVDEIRGVNTSFTLRQLSIRGLIEKIDNPSDARAYLYKISFDFLRHLGIEKIEDLPRYQELREKELISEKIIENGKEGLASMMNNVEKELKEENILSEETENVDDEKDVSEEDEKNNLDNNK
ncbi:MAG: SMC-Scp complex subunit ScpB [Candidatus Paceibacterota bacterium]